MLLHRQLWFGIRLATATRQGPSSPSTRRLSVRSMAGSAWKYPPPTVVEPASGKHTTSLLMLHGLGDSADGWADIAYFLAADLPHTRFVFPTAPVVGRAGDQKLAAEERKRQHRDCSPPIPRLTRLKAMGMPPTPQSCPCTQAEPPLAQPSIHNAAPHHPQWRLPHDRLVRHRHARKD
jgi:hypothetical protein